MKTIGMITLLILAAGSNSLACSNEGFHQTSTSQPFRDIHDVALRSPDAVNAADEREVIDRTEPGFEQVNAVGALFVGTRWVGTIFRAGKCGFVTANHAVTEDKVLTNTQLTNKLNKEGATIMMGQVGTPEEASASRPFAFKIKAELVKNGSGWGGVKRKFANYDWAVFRGKGPISDNLNILPLCDETNPISDKLPMGDVAAIGLPGDRMLVNGTFDFSKVYGDSQKTKCTFDALGGEGYVTETCQHTRGQSGSPIVRKIDGKLCAAGMVSMDQKHSFERTTDEKTANIALNFDSGKKFNATFEGDKIRAALELANSKCD